MIPLPNLDDRTFDDLVTEARSLIPTIYPAWTDHNPSDPGIVLTELFAWLSEMLIYQANEMTDQHKAVYLEYLNGPDWKLTTDLDTAIAETMTSLHTRYRAVTQDDYEELVRTQWPSTKPAQALGDEAVIQRIHCLPDINVESLHPAGTANGHISLIIIPPANNPTPLPTHALERGVWEFLEHRRLLGVQHHVSGPRYVSVTLSADCIIKLEATLTDTYEQIKTALTTYFHPLHGGADSQGWPLGRGIYASDIYNLLDKVPSVDYVENVRLQSPGREPSTVAIPLDPDQLIYLNIGRVFAKDHNKQFQYPLQASA